MLGVDDPAVLRGRGGDRVPTPGDVVPIGLDGLRRRLEEMIAVGASKFVVLPLSEPSDWKAELAAVADAVLDLET